LVLLLCRRLHRGHGSIGSLGRLEGGMKGNYEVD
jgi:hypothetical protein